MAREISTQKKAPEPQRFSGERNNSPDSSAVVKKKQRKEQECLVWLDEDISGPPAAMMNILATADLPLV